VSDDLSFWNVDFCQVDRSFTLARINALEVAVLEALKFNVAVGASEYGKYYFALRQMSAKSEQTSSSKDKDNSDASSTTANHHIQHARSDGDSGIYDGSAYDEHTAADKLSPSKLATRSSTTSLEQLHDNTAAAATRTSADTTQCLLCCRMLNQLVAAIVAATVRTTTTVAAAMTTTAAATVKRSRWLHTVTVAIVQVL
jgi:hypothetical protein